ncbi:hypothetical protein AAHA92_29409 [Salvia divinorum]|uniref:Uncharacterized protein n=1 Tax=Salvia divinorum TaxID=28513 RepID=A0ABD1FYA3_SALDI
MLVFEDALTAASDDESICLYDVASVTCLKTIDSKNYGVDRVSLASHSTTVIYSSKNGWDESLQLLPLHDKKYLRNDCFVSGSLDRTVLLWDQMAEKCQGLLCVQGRSTAAYDVQGLVFAVAFGGFIRLFDARKYEKGPFDIFQSQCCEVHHVLDSFHVTLFSTHNVKPISRNSTLEASFSPEAMFFISGSRK